MGGSNLSSADMIIWGWGKVSGARPSQQKAKVTGEGWSWGSGYASGGQSISKDPANAVSVYVGRGAVQRLEGTGGS